MKRRFIRATIIASVLGVLLFFGHKGGGEGFFPDPNQPVQPVDTNATLVFIAIVWLVSFLPWKGIVKRIARKQKRNNLEA